MSSDTDTKNLTEREVKMLAKEIGYWLKQSRDSPIRQYGAVAAGVAAGIKIAKDALEKGNA